MRKRRYIDYISSSESQPLSKTASTTALVYFTVPPFRLGTRGFSCSLVLVFHLLYSLVPWVSVQSPTPQMLRDNLIAATKRFFRAGQLSLSFVSFVYNLLLFHFA